VTPPATGAGALAPAGLDLAAAERWIVANVDGLVAPLTFRPVGQGRSNLTYTVEDSEGRSVVLRRPPLGQLLESAHDLSREVSVLSYLAAVGQPVPQLLAFCADPDVIGAQFYLMERVEGVVADSTTAVETALSVQARAQVGCSLAATLVSLHAVDVGVSGLAQPGKGGDYAGRQLRRWKHQWELVKTRDLALFDDIAARLERAIPPQQAVTIVHGDFSVANIVLSPQGSVRAILDWELWTVGDPIADLAWLLMWWPDDEHHVAFGAEPISLLPGFGRRAEIVREYVKRSGRQVDSLGWWQALSCWKLAAILEGVLHRFVADSANGGRDPEALRPGVTKLLELAAETADRLGL
jgi:aminoglycoside phosphotransferase (APT) family kinase protein